MHNFVLSCEENSIVALLSTNLYDRKFNREAGLTLRSVNKLFGSVCLLRKYKYARLWRRRQQQQQQQQQQHMCWVQSYVTKGIRVLTAVTWKINAFLENVTPCSPVVISKFKPWRWKKQNPQRLWELHSAISKNMPPSSLALRKVQISHHIIIIIIAFI
jgi:hypothetical protein